ncbi:MAG: anion permease [Clostridia bacterium]|nr:anion permease [Clostridia bacterium]
MKIKNKFLHYIMIVLSLVIMIGSAFVPAPSGMTQSMVRVLGILVGTMILWYTVSIDWPSILCIVMLGFVPELRRFPSIFGDIFAEEGTTLMFLITSYVCAYAISKTTLPKRVALTFMSSKFASSGAWKFIISFVAVVTVLGCFISPLMLYVVMLPILKEILDIAKIEKGEKVGSALMIGFVFTLTISSAMTPISHFLSILACSSIGLDFNFFNYMLVAIPMGLSLITIMILVLRIVMNPDVSKLENIDLKRLKNELPSTMKASEVLMLVLYSLALMTMILPNLINVTGSIEGDIILTTTLIFAIISLFVVVGFNAGMKSVIGIKEEKMALPRMVFSLFSFAIYVGSVVFVALDKKPLALLVMLLLVVIMLLVMFVSIFTNIKKGKAQKQYFGVKPFVAILVGAVLLTLMEVVYIYITPEKVFDFITAIPSYKVVMPMLILVVLMSIFVVNGENLVSLPQALREGTPWSSIILCMGTLALGTALTSQEVGLVALLQTKLLEIMPSNIWLILLLLYGVTLLIANLLSDKVTAKIVPMVALLAFVSCGINTTAGIYVLAMLINLGFVTPMSKHYIALAGGSEYTNVRQIALYGLIMMVITLILAVFVGYPLGLLSIK